MNYNVKCDLHIHTLSSGHAFNTIDECIAYAIQKKYDIIGISDHGPSMKGASHSGYFEMLYRLPKINNGVRILYGCEANILDEYGNLDLSDKIISSLDYVMAGLHKRTPYSGNSIEENTKAIVSTMMSGKVDIITHPVSWNFPVNVYPIIYAAAENNVILEANKTILLEAIARNKKRTISDYRTLLREAFRAGVNVIWGSDAHHISEMAFSDADKKQLVDVYNLDIEKLLNNYPEQLMKIIANRNCSNKVGLNK